MRYIYNFTHKAFVRDSLYKFKKFDLLPQMQEFCFYLTLPYVTYFKINTSNLF